MYRHSFRLSTGRQFLGKSLDKRRLDPVQYDTINPCSEEDRDGGKDKTNMITRIKNNIRVRMPISLGKPFSMTTVTIRAI